MFVSAPCRPPKPGLAGFILSAGEGMELVASFIIGIASDKTRSILGRRRPWIMAGMFLLPGTIIACFAIPPFNDSGKVAYYFCALIVYNILFPATSIPHQALSPELSGNYDTRMKLSTSRSSFSFVGMLSVVVYAFLVVRYLFPTDTEIQSLAPSTPDAPAAIIPLAPDVPVAGNNTNPIAVPLGTPLLPPLASFPSNGSLELAHMVIAAWPAAAVLLGGAITVGMVELVTPATPVEEQGLDAEEDEDDRLTIVKQGNFCIKMCRIFAIPAFDMVVAMFSLCSTAIAITGSLLPLYIVTTIGFEFETFTLVTIALTGTMVLTIIVLSRIAYRFEKKTLFNFGCILCILCSIGFYFVPGTTLPPDKLLPRLTHSAILGVDNTDPFVLRYGVYIMAGFVGIGHVRHFPT